MLAERLFGDHMPANMLVLGAAYQRGALPVSAAAIERAIELNGAAADTNKTAFAWGRACVAAPDAIEVATRPAEPAEATPELDDADRALVDEIAPTGGELRRLLELRVPELVAYQDRGYARRYLGFVREVREAEASRTLGETAATEAVARHLFKLMAYKDEYEVARLHLDAVERAKVSAEFGKGAKVWFNIHPPLLRALGLDRKLKLGRWFVPVFRLLRWMRRLRGTPLDVFGATKVRRTERRLVGEYRDLVRAAIDRLDPDTHARVVELCELPDVIRGYEEIKLRSVERFRTRSEALMEQIRQSSADAPAPAIRPVNTPGVGARRNDYAIFTNPRRSARNNGAVAQHPIGGGSGHVPQAHSGGDREQRGKEGPIRLEPRGAPPAVDVSRAAGKSGARPRRGRAGHGEAGDGSGALTAHI